MRLSPQPFWRAHVGGLTKHPNDAADVLTRVVLYGIPVVVFAASLVLDARLRQPAALLAGAALFAATLLASFGQLATLRARLTDRVGVPQVAKDALDETAAHVLMAVYASVLTAAVMAIATSLDDGFVTGFPAAVALASATWLLLLVLVIVPRLYQAYTYAFDVRAGLNGYVGKPPAETPPATRR